MDITAIYCGYMKTTLELDEKLIQEAMDVIGGKTMRATVELALRELIATRRREELAAMIGTTDFDMTLEDLQELRRKDKPHVSN